MNNKKWLAALAIIAVLAVAFFWGGDYGKSTQPSKSSEAASQVVEEGEVSLDEESERPTTTPDIAGANEPSLNPQATGSVIVEAGETSPASTEATGTPSATPKPKPDKPEATATVTSRPAETKTPATTQTTKEPDKDKYLTDPVPSGKPKPVEPQDVTVDKNKKLTVTLSVSAATILDNLDMLDEDKLEVLPKDGVIYKARKVTFYEGESVFDVLLREMKANKIHMEFEMTPIYNSNYIEGINNLYEFDCGELSGWMYKVNGWFPNYGSSRYKLKDGDVVDWVYTCDLGRDVGGDAATGGTGQ